MEDNKEKDFEEQNVHEEESGVRVQQSDGGFRVIPLKGLITGLSITLPVLSSTELCLKSTMASSQCNVVSYIL